MIGTEYVKCPECGKEFYNALSLAIEHLKWHEREIKILCGEEVTP